MHLPTPGGPTKNHVAGVIDKTQGPQLPDLALVDARLRSKVKLVEGITEREIGEARIWVRRSGSERLDLSVP